MNPFPDVMPIDNDAFNPVRLVEPVCINFSGGDELAIWRFSDHSVVIRIGPAQNIGAETILIEPHLIGTLARTLTAICEDMEAEVLMANGRRG